MNHKQLGFIVRVLGVVLFVLALQVAGFFTVNAVLGGLTGSNTLAPVWQFVFSALVGFAYFALLFVCAGLVMRINGHDKPRGGGGFDVVLMDAMDRIAQGDFNVFIQPEINGIYVEVVDAVNKMAQQLGTMENLRQDFISNVSHEIQSPLTSISGFARLLQDQGDRLSFEERSHYLTIIEAESKRLSKLSDNLMKLSSLESLEVQSAPINCGEFRLDRQLESVTLMLEPQWQAKGLVVEADLVPATYCGDEELLAQVWVNLLNNAIKFTPEGGTLRIALTLAQEEAGLPSSIAVCIADTGIGIAPEDQMHIFERFYKVDKARDRAAGGNGLGLSLTKKILDLHNARITVESELGNGTTFTVLL